MQDVTKGVTQLSSVLDMGYSSFGAVYDEKLWKDLQEYCKNATFYTKEEYEADMDTRHELDRQHDEYSHNYEGYIN
jgi:hypothetical protein